MKKIPHNFSTEIQLSGAALLCPHLTSKENNTSTRITSPSPTGPSNLTKLAPATRPIQTITSSFTVTICTHSKHYSRVMQTVSSASTSTHPITQATRDGSITTTSTAHSCSNGLQRTHPLTTKTWNGMKNGFA